MKTRFAVAAIFAGLIGSNLYMPAATGAYSYCSEPRAPSIYLSKPTKPFCATTRNCEQWQVDMYRNEVRSYYNDLETYADDVDRYYRNAADYVECMSDLD